MLALCEYEAGLRERREQLCKPCDRNAIPKASQAARLDAGIA
jgi:hypothetical protein